MSPYAFATSGRVEDQMACLQAALDPFTIVGLDRVGLDRGWSVWEFGVGGGSIARHIADRIGPDGQLTATDLDPRTDLIGTAPNMTVLVHDVVDQAPPVAGVDLVAERLALQHVRDTATVVPTLVQALKPGGMLMLQDFDCRRPPQIIRSPDPAAGELFHRVVEGILAVLEQHGANLGWGSQAYPAMSDAGLTDVTAHIHNRSWAGGTAGCLLHAVNTIQLADDLHQLGLAERELDDFRELMADPGFVAYFHTLVVTTGRRPR